MGIRRQFPGLLSWLLALAGFGMMVQVATSNTSLQTIVDEDKRGRVMGLYALALLGVTPLGSLLAGVLAGWAGVTATVLAGGRLPGWSGRVRLPTSPAQGGGPPDLRRDGDRAGDRDRDAGSGGSHPTAEGLSTQEAR
jgi:MFS family permease